MHHCKATRKRLIEAAMNRPSSDQSGSLLAEIERCPACREEFASLRNVLRVADQAMESTLPEESFWPGYHARLRQSLERGSPVPSRSGRDTGALVGLRSLLQRLANASVRVPVPVAAILIVFFGLTIVFATHARPEPINVASPVITRTVEVPVVSERTVTRVVYRNRPGPRDIGRLERTVAKATDRRNDSTESTPINLVGFKPTSDPRLTIIKGSYRDEK